MEGDVQKSLHQKHTFANKHFLLIKEIVHQCMNLKIRHKFLYISNRFWHLVESALNTNRFSNMNPGQTELSKNRLEPNLKPVGATSSKL